MTTYELVDGCIEARYSENGAVVTLKARDLRRSNTGPHAHIAVKVNDKGIAFDVLNIHRNASRNDLARATLKRLGDVERAALAKHLPMMLDEFCLGLWEYHLRNSIVSQQAGCDDKPEPLAFWIPDYIMEGGGTIAFAPPTAGKSYLMYTMAISIDAGCKLLWPVFQGKVGIVNLERPPKSIDRRIYYINQALGLDPRRKLSVIHARGKPLSDIADAVREQSAQEGWDVLMLDSISRAGMGKLVEDATANAIIDTLHTLAPTWLALAHTSWASIANDSHEFGSVMFRAGEDIGLRLLSQTLPNGSLGVGIDGLGGNDVRKPPMEILAFDFSPDPDSHLTAVRRAPKTEFPKLAMSKPVDIADQIRQLLLEVGRMSATDIASELGMPKNRSHVSELLNNDPRFRRAEKQGKSQLYEVVSPIES